MTCKCFYVHVGGGEPTIRPDFYDLVDYAGKSKTTCAWWRTMRGRHGWGSACCKVFEREGRFPRGMEELPAAAVTYIARQVGVEPDVRGGYRWAGRPVKYHRAQVREALGFREATRKDEAELTAWLAGEVARSEVSDERLRKAVLVRCGVAHIEPPARLDRVVWVARASGSSSRGTRRHLLPQRQ